MKPIAGRRILIVSIVILFLAATGVVVGKSITGENATKSRDVLRQYFDLLSASNFEIASDMWTPDVLERSQRFGIVYSDIPVRVDCNSEILWYLDDVRFDLEPPAQRNQGLSNTWTKLTFDRLAGGHAIKRDYYTEKRNNWYWFSYPQDFHAADWKQVESQYLRVRVHPSVDMYLNPIVLSEADRFIEAMCDTLDISGDLRREIEAKKIEYFYCAGDSVMQKLTGHLTKGMVHLPTNDVISSVFPHHHELTHLLVNIKLQELPLMTLPLLREGIAVRYGGRWGKHAAALEQLAVFMHKEKLVELDSILTYRGFDEQAGADIVYPVAGLFTTYLLERLGQDGFFELYRSLSGSYRDLGLISIDDIKAALSGALGKADWAAVRSDFDVFIDTEITERFAAVPGKISRGKVRLVGEGFKVTEDKDWLGFEFTPAPNEGRVDGNLVFAPTEELADGESSLFEEQYQRVIPFEGYRYGIRFDQNEVGLYDYVTNRLMAKYIWGITPSEEYFDEGTGTVSIKFRKWLVGSELPDGDDLTLLAN